MATDFSASSSFVGYLYQSYYALLLILDHGVDDPDYQISIETADDIVLNDTKENFEYFQLKHHIDVDHHGILTNASADLWKTIRVWCSILKEGSNYSLNKKFLLFTTSKAPTDSAAEKLKPGQVRDADDALSMLKETAVTSRSKSNKKSYDAFLELSEKEQKMLVENIYVLDNSPDILNVREKLGKKVSIFLKEEHKEDFFERFIGWWQNKVLDLLLSEQEKKILYYEVHEFVVDLRDQYSTDNLPIDFPEPFTIDESELEDNQKIFIKQLEIISLGNTNILKAISDYYRIFKQRRKWLDESHITFDELNKYEKKIIDEWEREFNRIENELEFKNGEVSESELMANGRNLFYQMDGKELRIRSKVIEPFVKRGTYHILSDDLKIGWHPEFIERLQELVS